VALVNDLTSSYEGRVDAFQVRVEVVVRQLGDLSRGGGGRQQERGEEEEARHDDGLAVAGQVQKL